MVLGRGLKIALIVLSTLIVLMAGTYVLIFKTGQGRAFILSMALPLGGEALNSTLTVGGTAGNWPGTIVLKDVNARDDNGEWFRADRLELSWYPIHSLLTGWNIRRITVENAYLDRLPNLPETKPHAGDDVFAVPTLPRGLPRLRIGEVSLTDLHLGPTLVAKETMVNGHGSLVSTAERLSLILSAHTDGPEREAFFTEISWDPQSNELEVVLDASAAENGVLSTVLRDIAGKPAPLTVKLEGSGPAANWTGKLAVDWTDIIDLDTDLLCTCLTSLNLAADISAALSPGASTRWRAVLGGEPKLSLRLAAAPQKGWRIELETLSTPVASIIDPVLLSLRSTRGGNRVEVSGSLALGTPLKQHLPGWLGTQIRIAADIPLKKSGQPKDGHLKLDMGPAAVELTDILATGDQISTTGTVTLSPEQEMPSRLLTAIGTGASLRGEISRTGNNAYTVGNGSIAMAGGLDGQFNIFYDPAGQDLIVDLTASLKASLAEGLIPQLNIDQPVELMASTQGSLSDLELEAGLNVPATFWTERPLPAAKLRLQAALRDTLIDGTAEIDLEAPRGEAGESGPRNVITDALTMHLTYSEAKGFRVNDVTIAYPGLEGTGSAHINGPDIDANLAMEIADLSVLDPDAAGDLTFDMAFEQTQNRSSINGNAKSNQLSYRGNEAETINLSVNGPFDALGVEMQAVRIRTTPMDHIRRFSTSLTLSEEGGETTVQITDLTGQWKGDVIALRAPATLTVAERSTRIESLTFKWGEKGSLSAALSLTPARLEATADLTQIPVADLPILVSGRLDLDTSRDTPGHLTLSLAPLRGAEIDAGAVIDGVWDGETIRLSAALETPENAAGEQAPRTNFLSLALPLRAEKTDDSFKFILGNDMNGRLAYKNKLENLTTLFLSRDNQVSGNLDLAGTIFGPSGNPEITLEADLSNAVYEQIATGTRLTDLSARLEGSGTLDNVSGTLSLEASDGTSISNDAFPVIGNASFALVPESGMTTRAELALRKARVIRRDDIDMTLSGRVSLFREQGEAAKLAGEVVIDKADILIPESSVGAEVVDVNVVAVKNTPKDDNEEIRTDLVRPERMLSPLLEITIKSDEQLFVRGRGLETEWQGNLKIGGTVATPRVAGALQLREGTLSFAGRQFDITQGQISFLGGAPEEAVLNIVAEYMAEDGTKAIIRIAQSASSPSVTLESVPSLPQDTIMSLILFGKPATELSALEALQVTQALAELSGTDPFGNGRGIVDRIRGSLDLDLLKLNVNQDETNGTAVGLSVGKYVRKGVFVSASQDTAGQSGTVSVRVDVTKSFSIATDIAQGGDNTLTLQWRRDY